eukprot:m.124527 g.124527  ORF g.124527 m.124527 type:complete len:310 (+) comp9425_c11_seq1:26-955(+)
MGRNPVALFVRGRTDPYLKKKKDKYQHHKRKHADTVNEEDQVEETEHAKLAHMEQLLTDATTIPQESSGPIASQTRKEFDDDDNNEPTMGEDGNIDDDEEEEDKGVEIVKQRIDYKRLQHRKKKRELVLKRVLASKTDGRSKVKVKGGMTDWSFPLQPRAGGYGGQGFSKETTWIPLLTPTWLDEFEEAYDEHIEGFSGKAFSKSVKRQRNAEMTWKKMQTQNEGKEGKFDMELEKLRQESIGLVGTAGKKKSMAKRLAERSQRLGNAPTPSPNPGRNGSASGSKKSNSSTRGKQKPTKKKNKNKLLKR